MAQGSTGIVWTRTILAPKRVPEFWTFALLAATTGIARVEICVAIIIVDTLSIRLLWMAQMAGRTNIKSDHLVWLSARAR
jgi:hypothetical protein